jgi:cytochrome c oxidase subunit 3
LADRQSGVATQFENMEQQHEAATLGMWAFLVTEILFFGGLFVVYMVYRSKFPSVFAEASHELNVTLGGINTGVLLASSLTVALAIHAAQEGKFKIVQRYLAVTMVFGLTFLVIKGFEYAEKFRHHLFPGQGFTFHGADPQNAQLYFILYFMMTGLHALHMIIGIGVLMVMMVKVAGEVHIRILCPRGGVRALLAFRGYCLDFPVSPSLPH